MVNQIIDSPADTGGRIPTKAPAAAENERASRACFMVVWFMVAAVGLCL